MASSGKTQVQSHFTLIILLQAVMYAAIWLWNEYVASYITLIFPGMILIMLVLSAIADLIEPSRISSWYYKIMLVSIAVPIAIAIIFYFIYDGRIDWLEE